MNAKDRKIIERSPLFAGLTEEGVERILRALDASEAKYPRGEVLHAAGDPMERFALVLSGRVRLLAKSMDGVELPSADIAAGECFGLPYCLLRTQNVPFSAAAAQDCRVLWLAPFGINGTAQSDPGPDISERLMALLAQSSFAAEERVQVLSQRTLRRKIYALLKRCSQEAMGKAFTVPLSREEMALYLGCDRSALSRELARMKADGLIDYNRNSFKVMI